MSSGSGRRRHMTREPGMLQAASRPLLARALMTGAAFCTLVVLTAPALAQQTVFVGRGNPNDVILDLSVLNKLGPPPKIARSIAGSPPPARQAVASEPILLTPPGETAAGTEGPGKEGAKERAKASAKSAPAKPAAPTPPPPRVAAATPSAGPPPPPVITEPPPLPVKTAPPAPAAAPA